MVRFASVCTAAAFLLLGAAPSFAANNGGANLNSGADPANTAPADADSGLVTKLSLDDIQAILQEDGYRAQVKHDSTGDYVASASSGRAFFLSLGACDDQKVCKSLLMETGGWTPKTTPTVEAINKFSFDNGGWIAVMTYNDGKYYADYRVALVGGVTKDWLKYTFETFATSTENFAAFMQK